MTKLYIKKILTGTKFKSYNVLTNCSVLRIWNLQSEAQLPSHIKGIQKYLPMQS